MLTFPRVTKDKVFALFWSWCRPAAAPLTAGKSILEFKSCAQYYLWPFGNNLKQTTESFFFKEEESRLLMRGLYSPVAETPCILHKLLLWSFSAQTVFFSRRSCGLRWTELAEERFFSLPCMPMKINTHRNTTGTSWCPWGHGRCYPCQFLCRIRAVYSSM